MLHMTSYSNIDLYHQSLRTDQKCVCQDRYSHICTEGRYIDSAAHRSYSILTYSINER